MLKADVEKRLALSGRGCMGIWMFSIACFTADRLALEPDIS